MEPPKTKEIIERAYERYAQRLISWALTKFKSKEDAEDLCHETILRLYDKLISCEFGGGVIRDLDGYIWKIAYSLYHEHGRGTARDDKISKAKKLDLDLEIQELSGHEIANIQETEEVFQKLRKSILSLDYNHREAMIMYHLEKKTLQEISEKLKITEAYVKKLLTVARQQVKTSFDEDNEYRTENLLMTFSGEEFITPDFLKISDSLSKQNICLACYSKPRGVDELAKLLGLPCEYVEFDIRWLKERGFVKQQKTKYLATFFVYDETFNARLINTFTKHKVKCLDKIVAKLTEQEVRIRRIGFTHSDKPLNELLWLLIYSFTDIASERVCYNLADSGIKEFIRADGGRYYPIGLFKNRSLMRLDPLFESKYKDLMKWECNGTYTFDDGENKLSWLGLYNAREDFYSKLSHNSFAPDVFNYKETLFKIMGSSLNVKYLSVKERYVLSQLLNFGYISVSENGKKAIPNFYVFTPEQKREFDDILIELYGEVKTEFTDLYSDLRRMCKEYLPAQLTQFLNYLSYFCLLFSHIFTTGFAFYDGLLYDPKDAKECTLLTLAMTLSDKPIDTEKKYYVNMKLNLNLQ
jgi:RNA polymerase sigma factor (sigma-70 family)